MTDQSYPWRESLEVCKTDQMSYLTGNISLSNAPQACTDANQGNVGPHWVGVVKDLYVNYDKGINDITILRYIYRCRIGHIKYHVSSWTSCIKLVFF